MTYTTGDRKGNNNENSQRASNWAGDGYHVLRDHNSVHVGGSPSRHGSDAMTGGKQFCSGYLLRPTRTLEQARADIAHEQERLRFAIARNKAARAAKPLAGARPNLIVWDEVNWRKGR